MNHAEDKLDKIIGNIYMNTLEMLHGADIDKKFIINKAKAEILKDFISREFIDLYMSQIPKWLAQALNEHGLKIVDSDNKEYVIEDRGEIRASLRSKLLGEE